MLKFEEVTVILNDKFIGLPKCPNCDTMINFLPRFKETLKLKKSQVVQVFDQYFLWKSNLSKMKEILINENCGDNENFKKYVISRCQDKSSPLGLAEAQQLKLKMSLMKQFHGKSQFENILQYLQTPKTIIGPGYVQDLIKICPDLLLEDFYTFSTNSWIFCADTKKVKSITK